MMRLIIGLVALVIVVAIVLPIVHYGTTDPCRMLAQDLADDNYRAIAKTMGVEPGTTPESAYAMARMVTSQYSQKECVVQLKNHWLGIEPKS